MGSEEDYRLHYGMIAFIDTPQGNFNSWWLVRNPPASFKQPPGLCSVAMDNRIASAAANHRDTAFHIPGGGALDLSRSVDDELHAVKGGNFQQIK